MTVQLDTIETRKDEEVRDLIARSREADVAPEEALEMAREALKIAKRLDDTSLRLDAAVNLLRKLSRSGLQEEFHRLAKEWRTTFESVGTANQRANFGNTIAVEHLEHSEFPEALRELRPLLIDPSEIDNHSLLTMVQINMGGAYSGLGIYDMAVMWFYEALRNAEDMSNDSLCSYIHNNLGVLHRKLGEFDRSVAEFEEVIRLARKNNDEDTLAKALANVSGIFHLQKEYSKAIEHNEISYQLRLKQNDMAGIQVCLTNKGVYYQELGELDKALECFRQALEIATELGIKHQIANLSLNKAKIHLERGNLRAARPLFDRARVVAEEIGAQDLLNDLFSSLTEFHAAGEDWKSAYDAQENYMHIREEVFLGRQREVIDEMRIRYESEQLEREAQAARERNQELEAEIGERKKVEAELKEALSRIKALTGILPVCMHCKKIRDEEGKWVKIEEYITLHSDTQFSHGVCPECLAVHYPVD